MREVTTATSVASSSIGIAFSGGLDSSVLLDSCVAVFGAARCFAFHIHHGLQTAADDWLTHCASVCARLGVAFVARRVTLPAGGAGDGIEAAARQARYQALRDLAAAQGIPIVLLGHHADDQAETVMLQLLRGAGLPGLAAMPLARNDAETPGLQWCRPLLPLTRETLERYAHRRGLRWIDDTSNDDRRFVRNALRHDVMPAIAAHFPAYRTTLARVARHAAASQQLLTTLAEEDWARCQAPRQQDDGSDGALSDAVSLSLRALRTLSPARIENLLRHWVRVRGLAAPSAARLAEMLSQIVGKGGVPGQRASIAHAGESLHFYRDRVYWSSAPRVASSGGGCAMDAEGATACWRFDGQARWAPPGWAGHFAFVADAPEAPDLPELAETADACRPSDAASPALSDGAAAWRVPLSALLGREIEVRPRAGGEKMRLGARRPLRTLKQLYQSSGVPAWQRAVPLLYVDGALCYVPYVGGYLADAAGEGDVTAGEGDVTASGVASPSDASTPMLTVRWCPAVD